MVNPKVKTWLSLPGTILVIGLKYFCIGCIFVTCCCSFPSVICGTAKMRERQRKEEACQISKWRKWRKNNKPKSLPRRRRALSASPGSRKLQSQSENSPLLQLPFEIREQILLEAFGNGLLHLIQLPRRLGHIRCGLKLDHYEDCQKGRFCDMYRQCFRPEFDSQPSFDDIPSYHYNCESTEPRRRTPGCLALLQACRRLYLDALPILYQSNTFDINHPQTLLFLARTLRPRRLETIRSLQVSWQNVRADSHLGRDHDITGRTFGPSHLFNGAMQTIRLSPREDAHRAPDDMKTWAKMWDIIGVQMNGLQHLMLQLHFGEFRVVASIDQLEYHVRTRLGWMLDDPKSKVRGLRSFDLRLQGSFIWAGSPPGSPTPDLDLEQLQDELEGQIRAICVA